MNKIESQQPAGVDARATQTQAPETPEQAVERVFAAIRAEFLHSQRWDRERLAKGKPEHTMDRNKPVESWLLWMEEYLAQARSEATKSVDKTAALDAVRKVANLAVACLAYHGCPERKAQTLTMNGIERYSHHGREVAVFSHLKGRHREHCLCHAGCAHFKPGQPGHCEIAAANYELCKRHGVTTPVFECPRFEATAATAPASGWKS